MARGRWQPTDEALAKEAFLVLIRAEKPTRTYTKAALRETLKTPGIYLDFLKHCLEWDDSKRADQFRKGLGLTVRAIGASQVAKATGVSRVSLYRMLAKGGNPRLSSLAAVFYYLGLRLWVVDDAFVLSRKRLTRAKDEIGRLQPRYRPVPPPKPTGRPKLRLIE